MNRDRIYQFTSVGALLAVWQLTTAVVPVVDPAVLPPPSRIVAHTAALLVDPRFLGHAAGTLRRTAVASFVACLVGVPLGVAMGWNDTLKAALEPQLSAIYPLPVLALLPLVMLLFGTGDRSIVFAASLGGFFLVLWNSMTGVRSIEAIYFDVAEDNGAALTWTLFREVLFPGALPMILVGLRLCLNTVLLIVISAELVAGDSGLGYFLWVSYQTYTLPDVYGSLLVVGLIGVGITYGLATLSESLVPWQAGDERPVENGPAA